MEKKSIMERELAAQKLYDATELKRIEKVLAVFADYIKSATHFDILWSNKVGYIFLNDIGDPDFFDAVPSRIENAEEICERLLYEVGVDAMVEIGRTIDISDANTMERQIVEGRLKPYIEQLPEYQGLLPNIVSVKYR